MVTGMHLTSISQPPSARVSPNFITGDTLYSPSSFNRIPGQRIGPSFLSRSQNNSPLLLPGNIIDPNLQGINTSSASIYGHGFPYYDDPGSPIMDARTGVTGGIIHGPRARSARAGIMPRSGYSTLDARGGMDGMMMDRTTGVMTADPYMMRDPRDRSLDRLDMRDPMTGRIVRGRDRSLDRSFYLRDEHTGGYRDPLLDDPYRDPTRTAMSHSVPVGDPRHAYSRDSFIMELQARLNELQTQYAHVKRELDATTQKLGSSMHSIKTFWSPELKKERALRKEEAAKYALLSDQLKILRSENQVSLFFHSKTKF